MAVLNVRGVNIPFYISTGELGRAADPLLTPDDGPLRKLVIVWVFLAPAWPEVLYPALLVALGSTVYLVPAWRVVEPVPVDPDTWRTPETLPPLFIALDDLVFVFADVPDIARLPEKMPDEAELNEPLLPLDPPYLTALEPPLPVWFCIP